MPISIRVSGSELFDESTSRIFTVPAQTLVLEHSLVSISKWESKWHKMFLETPKKTGPEFLDYLRCMTINKNVDPAIYYCLSQENINDIVEYMDDPMSASHVNEFGRSGPHENVSSELIYYWLFTYGIPIDVEKWHINRLLMLLKIFSRKNSKASKADMAAMNKYRSELNKKRCAELGTRG